MGEFSPLVVGNWKMNGLRGSEQELFSLIVGLRLRPSRARVLLCPPATLICRFSEIAKGGGVEIGAQDCHAVDSGAYTGDLSARMLADSGAVATILGHSERRIGHGEKSASVKAKVQAAHRAGLVAIVCVGETGAQRRSGETVNAVRAQLRESLPDDEENAWDRTVVAYEPVWAIGTGKTPAVEKLEEMHRAIREELRQLSPRCGEGVKLLYGGSLTPQNATLLLSAENVDGALVGGASLCAASFLELLSVYAS